jgi:hypothetical protein
MRALINDEDDAPATREQPENSLCAVVAVRAPKSGVSICPAVRSGPRYLPHAAGAGGRDRARVWRVRAGRLLPAAAAAVGGASGPFRGCSIRARGRSHASRRRAGPVALVADAAIAPVGPAHSLLGARHGTHARGRSWLRHGAPPGTVDAGCVRRSVDALCVRRSVDALCVRTTPVRCTRRRRGSPAPTAPGHPQQEKGISAHSFVVTHRSSTRNTPARRRPGRAHPRRRCTGSTGTRSATGRTCPATACSLDPPGSPFGSRDA